MSYIPSDFPLWISETVRYRDLDTNGHVNNAVYLTYCESGRSDLRRRLTSRFKSVVGEIRIRYRRSLTYPSTLRVGTGIRSISSRTYVVATGIFVGEVCHATADTVSVCIDPATGRAIELPQDARADLARFLLPGAAGDPS